MSRNKFSVKFIAIMLCIAAIMSIGVVAAGVETQEAPSASEGTEGTQAPPQEGPMKVSDELLRVLKQLEGFSPYAYWDYKQYSIGYGSVCPEGYELYYSKVEDGGQGNQITEEYAEELLRG